MFISEHLVILLKKSEIVHNMHEAYARLSVPSGSAAGSDAAGPSAAGPSAADTEGFDHYGYGTFISGPSKTADIAQVLVMGAQAARSATVLLMP